MANISIWERKWDYRLVPLPKNYLSELSTVNVLKSVERNRYNNVMSDDFDAFKCLLRRDDPDCFENFTSKDEDSVWLTI